MPEDIDETEDEELEEDEFATLVGRLGLSPEQIEVARGLGEQVGGLLDFMADIKRTEGNVYLRGREFPASDFYNQLLTPDAIAWLGSVTPEERDLFTQSKEFSPVGGRESQTFTNYPNMPWADFLAQQKGLEMTGQPAWMAKEKLPTPENILGGTPPEPLNRPLVKKQPYSPAYQDLVNRSRRVTRI